MFEQVLAILKELEGQDEIFDVMARLYKKSYDSLLKAGFTSEQAARIVAGQSTQSLRS